MSSINQSMQTHCTCIYIVFIQKAAWCSSLNVHPFTPLNPSQWVCEWWYTFRFSVWIVRVREVILVFSWETFIQRFTQIISNNDELCLQTIKKKNLYTVSCSQSNLGCQKCKWTIRKDWICVNKNKVPANNKQQQQTTWLKKTCNVLRRNII